tara:strand:+ start:979 stop:2757 length:1779 start_codon:yes stop_codon:yes gene_type:complete
MTDIVPIAPPQLTNLDGLTNVMTGLGTEKSKRAHNTWQYGVLNDYSQLDAAYATNWIARKICDIPAEDATREWRRVKCDGAEDIAALEQQLLVPNMVQEAATWANLYGGSGILMITNQDLTKPLRVDRIKKGELKRLLVLDRWDMASAGINTWDILASNYLQPEYFNVRGGAMQIHHSHFAIFKGERLPLRQQAQTQGWGDSKLRKCIEDIADMVAAKDGIAELMQEANIDVITRDGLTDELSTDQDDAIIKRYELFSMMKSNIQMALLDGEEKFDRMTLNLSGVAPIIEQFMTWISGAADIPVTRMFGTSAKGMNATGEGDDRNYNNSIRASQRKDFAQPMRTLDEVLVRSALGSFPSDYDYEWNPLSLPDGLQTAQAEKLRSEKHQTYLDAGIVQKSQVMRELQASEEYQFDDKELEELEELEEGNMFDEPVDAEEDPTNVNDVDVNNGYASVKPDKLTALKIVEHLKTIGITDHIPNDELHVTLMYSKDNNINVKSNPTKIYNATQKGEPEIMGNDPYRALVIKLDSDELHGRFVELLLSGAEHSYPDFTPHLSLKYAPTEQDLKLLRDNPIQIGDIKLTGEMFKSTKE